MFIDAWIKYHDISSMNVCQAPDRIKQYGRRIIRLRRQMPVRCFSQKGSATNIQKSG